MIKRAIRRTTHSSNKREYNEGYQKGYQDALRKIKRLSLHESCRLNEGYCWTQDTPGYDDRYSISYWEGKLITDPLKKAGLTDEEGSCQGIFLKYNDINRAIDLFDKYTDSYKLDDLSDSEWKYLCKLTAEAYGKEYDPYDLIPLYRDFVDWLKGTLRYKEDIKGS